MLLQTLNIQLQRRPGISYWGVCNGSVTDSAGCLVRTRRRRESSSWEYLIHDYCSAKNKKEKHVIALEVVQLVRTGGDGASTNPSPPPGRFLAKDASSVLGAHGGHWWIKVEETKAIAKTSKALRDCEAGTPKKKAAASVANAKWYRSKKRKSAVEYTDTSTTVTSGVGFSSSKKWKSSVECAGTGTTATGGAGFSPFWESQFWASESSTHRLKTTSTGGGVGRYSLVMHNPDSVIDLTDTTQDKQHATIAERTVTGGSGDPSKENANTVLTTKPAAVCSPHGFVKVKTTAPIQFNGKLDVVALLLNSDTSSTTGTDQRPFYHEYEKNNFYNDDDRKGVTIRVGNGHGTAKQWETVLQEEFVPFLTQKYSKTNTSR